MLRFLRIGLLLFLFPTQQFFAQIINEPWISWENFVEEYVEGNEWEEDESPNDAQLEYLENLAQNPLQINRATREQMLLLPFVNEEQIDSLLSYIRAKRGIRALGELQLIKGWDYYTRRYFSLFVKCDSLPIPITNTQVYDRDTETKIGKKITQGNYELETRLDIPFYKRKGYETPKKPSKTNFYTGNALHHILRFRYMYQREVAYGLTMEKDAGEPIGKHGFYPYDYLSAYFLLKPQKKSWSFVVGDYEIRSGRGLLFGRQFFAGREQMTQTVRRNTTSFYAHTSMDESQFFRGGAATYSFGKAEVMAFFSYRKLDTRMEDKNDTVRSIITTGLHRTVNEINQRRTLDCLTAGASFAYNQTCWGLNIDGYFSSFNHFVLPETRYYNTYYFRGERAGGASLSYFFEKGKWKMQGELATDHHFYLSTEHMASLALLKRLVCNIQVRIYSPRFVSLYGNALQQGSRVANEQGVLMGLRYRSRSNWELNGYLDIFRFPEPTYNSRLSGAKGLEAQLQGKCKINSHWNLSARYRLKTRQRSITGYENSMEYRTCHRLRFAALWSGKKTEVNMQLDGSYASRQTGKHSLGGMYSTRLAYKATNRLLFKAFASLFFTDDYESAVYAYEPQLPRAASFCAFAYHGTSAVALCSYNITKQLSFALRFSLYYLFNRNTQSSGIATIPSAWKNDLQIQLRWRLKQK